uniref:Uncharacterized protein n=2 Tax=Schistocephalus solidus TaxID=70667 RepID=A0A0X3Q4G4_SCHSO
MTIGDGGGGGRRGRTLEEIITFAAGDEVLLLLRLCDGAGGPGLLSSSKPSCPQRSVTAPPRRTTSRQKSSAFTPPAAEAEKLRNFSSSCRLRSRRQLRSAESLRMVATGPVARRVEDEFRSPEVDGDRRRLPCFRCSRQQRSTSKFYIPDIKIEVLGEIKSLKKHG